MIGARPNDIRGRTLRAHLEELVRDHAAASKPLPSHRDIAELLGVSAPQITRHLNRMMDAGVFSPVCRHTRIYAVIERRAA